MIALLLEIVISSSLYKICSLLNILPQVPFKTEGDEPNYATEATLLEQLIRNIFD